MKNLISTILQHTIPHVNAMEELIVKDARESLQLVETPCGRFVLSKTLVDNYMKTADISKELIKEMVSNMPVTGWVTGNPFYNLLSIYLITFLATNKIQTAVATARFYSAVTCSYLKAKYFPMCDEEVLRYSITQMHGASVVKQGFTKLCIKVADATLYKYAQAMVNTLDKQIFYRYLVDIRNKLNQSMKIIAYNYYDIQKNNKQTNYEELAEKINRNIIHTASSEKIIDYIASETNLSPIEIENFFVSLIDHVDATLAMQMLILKLLMLYNGPENINTIGARNIVNRAYRTEEIARIIKDVFDITQQKMTVDNMKVILYLAVILILTYR